MGLDCSHDAWRGAYTAFRRWRIKLAEVAGLPPLELMEGFYAPLGLDNRNSTFRWGLDPSLNLQPTALGTLDSLLPIKWGCLKENPLNELLNHSDCDGEIPADRCEAIADELEKLIPLLPNEDAGGHIGNWREKTQFFVDGLRRAAKAGEPLEFY